MLRSEVLVLFWLRRLKLLTFEYLSNFLKIKVIFMFSRPSFLNFLRSPLKFRFRQLIFRDQEKKNPSKISYKKSTPTPFNQN